MERWEIESSKKTPEIMLDPEGLIKFSGRSIHEDPAKFFDPVVEWINNYCTHPQEVTIIEIKLEYFNSGSAKYILRILQILSGLILEGRRLVINWFYEEGDDDILERGEYYASILDTNFNFIEFV